MSWSIKLTGTKAGASKEVAAQMDKIAAQYAAKPEADDVVAAKARILALIEAADLTPDAYTKWNALDIAASGSHSTTDKGVTSASMQLSVARVAIALD